MKLQLNELIVFLNCTRDTQEKSQHSTTKEYSSRVELSTTVTGRNSRDLQPSSPLFTRFQGDGLLHTSSFYAKHMFILIITEISHRLCSLIPGIPHHWKNIGTKLWSIHLTIIASFKHSFICNIRSISIRSKLPRNNTKLDWRFCSKSYIWLDNIWIPITASPLFYTIQVTASKFSSINRPEKPCF